MLQHQFTRRGFMGSVVGLASSRLLVPDFVRASALGLGGAVPPGDRVVMAAIGCGGKGKDNTAEFLKRNDVQLIAVCDVDRRHAAEDKRQVDAHYGNSDCRTYSDFRELLNHEQLDAVHVSTPDHWHALTSIAAMKAGCDVYCEKPLANSIGEARAIRDAAQGRNRVLQTGSHERSNPQVRFAAELARRGSLGKLSRVEVNMPCGDEPHHQQVMRFRGIPAPMPVPPQLDWDFWLGHTQVVPYHERRAHFWWRFILAYGGGEMTDRGAHIIDIAQLALNRDDSGPVSIKAEGQRNAGSLYDAFMDYHFDCTYADGVEVVGRNRGPRGLKIVGDTGSVFIHIHGGALQAQPAELLDGLASRLNQQHAPGHHGNFVECVKSREQPVANAEVGCRTATVCHLVNIAMLTGRPLTWDPLHEKIVGDDEANQWIRPSMRAPWKLSWSRSTPAVKVGRIQARRASE